MRFRRFTWGLAALVALLLVGRSVLMRYGPARAAVPPPAAPSTSATALGELWKVPAFSLHDQNGATASPAALAGHVWIADFIFTTCQSQCPLLSAKLVLLQRKLADPRLRFVSFSVDPTHDTPQALANYAKNWNAAETRWLLLATEPSSLSAISAGMHVAVEPSDNVKSPILHSTLFFLVDAAGSVRGTYDSEDAAAIERLRADTKTLLQSSADLATLPASGAALFRPLAAAVATTTRRSRPRSAGFGTAR